MRDRKAFNFYRSHWEQIKRLSDGQQLELFQAICAVQFMEAEIKDIQFNDEMTDLIWIGIKHSIETSLNGFLAKKNALEKGDDKLQNRPLAKGGNRPPYEQEKEKEEEEDKEEEEVKEKYKKKETVNDPGFPFKKNLIALGVEIELASDFLKARKTKRAANTKTAFNALLKQFEKSGLTPQECVKIATENSWAGFNAEWLADSQVLNFNETNKPKTHKGFSVGQIYNDGKPIREDMNF